MAEVIERGRIRVGELALDSESRLVLVRRLIKRVCSRCSVDRRAVPLLRGSTDREGVAVRHASTVTAWIAIEQPAVGTRGTAGEPVSDRSCRRGRAARRGARGPALLIGAAGSLFGRADHAARPLRGLEPVLVRRPFTRPEEVLEVDLAALAAGDAMGPASPAGVPGVHPRATRHLLCRSGKTVVPGGVGPAPGPGLGDFPHWGRPLRRQPPRSSPGAYFGRVEPRKPPGSSDRSSSVDWNSTGTGAAARCTESPRQPITSCGPDLAGPGSMMWRWSR